MTAARPVVSVEELVAYFSGGETLREDWRVGTEHEKIGIYPENLARVPYEGDRGIGALLERIASADGWKPVFENGNPVALTKEGASITLEPGGQIELSGAPLVSVRETCAEFRAHVDLLNGLSDEIGLAWLGLGGDPFGVVSEIPVMPKARYDIMRSYLPGRGVHALDMMLATATVQANFDYASEPDMAAKMRTALGCSPIVSALFANSPLSEGRENGFVSRRQAIWRDVDPDRCGLLSFVFDPEFGYRDYAEWALDVPMFFVVRDHHYLPANGMTFRRFMREGFAGERATIEDWDLHLTTLFPEVRLKRFIEVRGADAVPGDLICALPALWKGILYDSEASAAAWTLARSWSIDQRQAAIDDVARLGLGARIGDLPVIDLARELVEISGEGLRRISAEEAPGADERSFLEPLRAQLELGKSPGQVILDRWRGEWNGDPRRLIDYARY